MGGLFFNRFPFQFQMPLKDFDFSLKVQRLLDSGRMPVIVGGTLYYIESLLWKVLVDDPADASSASSDDDDEGEGQLTVFERDRLLEERQKINDSLPRFGIFSS